MREKEKQEGNGESKNENPSSDEQRNKRGGGEISIWEWIVAFVGLALVLGTVGFVLYEGIWGKETPPDVKVKIESIEHVSNGYLVKFKAFNQGGSTMAGVVLEADLKSGDEKIETSQTTLHFLPANSERQGGFFFSKNPQEYKLEARAAGYQLP